MIHRRFTWYLSIQPYLFVYLTEREKDKGRRKERKKKKGGKGEGRNIMCQAAG